jgi:transposase InsO family protein
MLILLLFIDDASRKVLDFRIKREDKVLRTLQKFHMVVERETNKLLICNIIDNGGEYFSKSFEEYCSKRGIKHVKTFPCTPQQNGMVERMNRTIVEKVRSMLSNPYFPKYFWAEVVHIDFCLINLSPTTSSDDGIREKVWTDKRLCFFFLFFFFTETARGALY